MTIVTTSGTRASSASSVSPFDLVHRLDIRVEGENDDRQLDPDLLPNRNIDDLVPVRGGKSHVNAPNFSGKHFHSGLRRHVWFESRLEQQFVELTECDDSVVGIAPQPIKLHWVDAHHRDHVPDYLVRHRDGRLRIINVRPAERVAKSEAMFDLVEAFAASIGIEAEVFTGLDTEAQLELSFLHRYRLSERSATHEFDQPVTPRWVYEQADPALVRDMWIAVAHGYLAADGTVLDDDCILTETGGAR